MLNAGSSHAMVVVFNHCATENPTKNVRCDAKNPGVIASNAAAPGTASVQNSGLGSHDERSSRRGLFAERALI
jgi:hypothetical protein